MRVKRVDTAEDVPVNDGSFLLRVTTDAETGIERCYMRHIASGREAYVQGGPNLRTFITACVLQSKPPNSSTGNEPKT
ncbi:MAG TPA: hypothetical protein VKU38_05475 [Ktedonobacteraceae bacterium]|nr:hypothetical protein [Ktedonobacteraceae bacterium]